MRKKILGWGLLAAFVLTAGAGLVLRQQFYGNAVVTERAPVSYTHLTLPTTTSV